jgi:hypothetical protein
MNCGVGDADAGDCYSARTATAGSTRTARTVGIKLPASVIITASAIAIANVAASPGSSPASSDCIALTSADSACPKKDRSLCVLTSARRSNVLAAVRYLHANGAKTVSVVGASMGGDTAEGALGEAKPGEIDRVVLLAHGAYGPPERLKGRKLFIVSRDDLGSGDKPRLTKIRAQYDKAPDPKELVILEGSAHAQFIFQTDQGERLMSEILRFLSAP